jgi:ribosomal-protein-alanine N-acetyltransferase
MLQEKIHAVAGIFSDLPVLETEHLRLRKLRLEDAPDMFAYASVPRISRYTVWDYHRSPDDARAYIECVLRNYEQGAVENWGIACKENDRLIGTAGFFSWEPEHARADINYALSLEYSGRGLMTEAVRRIVRFGFEDMRLNRIEANCMPENIGSERVMQKAGMHYEGIKREAVFAKGIFHDVKMYSILRKEYETEYAGR